MSEDAIGPRHMTAVEPPPVSSSAAWLLSPRADFWGVAAGGGALLIAMALLLTAYGDRELGVADLILGELHLGATYGVIARRQLWRRMPVDVLAIPLAIAVATYVLLWHDGALLVTTVVIYFGAWHRGRQSLGIARHYQRHAGGPVSSRHAWLLSTAFYLPMIAGVAYFTSTAPSYEGDPFHGLSLGAEITWGLAGAAAVSVLAYLAWTAPRIAAPGDGPRDVIEPVNVHPGERWLVLANALGFGSAYVLGAWNEAYIVVLAIHHEVQYLYFTAAVARAAEGSGPRGVASELGRLARFSVWPAIGVTSWMLCKTSGLDGLEPFLIAGLLAHYWLDGRIWTARARRLGAVAPA